MSMRRVLVLCLVLAGVVACPPARAAFSCDTLPPDRQMSDEGVLPTDGIEGADLASGRYALPEHPEQATQLVVMMHGYGNNSCSWRDHLRSVASRGAVAVAMDYTGQDPVTNRGWAVTAGAEDSIEAARYFLAAYPSIETVIAFGISMGGNTAGQAVAHPDAVRADGSPLFDYLVAVEGVHSFTELYAIAFAIKDFNATAANFVADAEAEAGGKPHEAPEAFLRLTNVARAREMAYLKGAILVHGLDDGTVPSNQTREMATALRGVNVRIENHTVVGRGSGSPGSTLTSNLFGQPWNATGRGPYPTAGHGWEGDPNHLVIKTGFDRLWELMEGTALVDVHRDTIVLGLPSI